jgi:hypothetical protein
MGGMVPDAELLANHLGHAGRRPDVAEEAVGLGSLPQQRGKLRPLLYGQSGLAPQPWAPPERIAPPFPHGL